MKFAGGLMDAGYKVALSRIKRYAPEGETLNVSLARLARAIRADGGEEYSPYSILKAYCHYPSLRRDYRKVAAEWKREHGK